MTDEEALMEDLRLDEICEYMTRMYREACDRMRDWEEPRGQLVPTEPDRHERARIRAEYYGALVTLERLSHCVGLRGVRAAFARARNNEPDRPRPCDTNE